MQESVDIWPRERLEEAQTQLRDTPGVTVLIYHQACATDLRRKRRRGLVPDPMKRVYINEAVCEGCGDCGAKSNCLSVFPVETEFGRKTQIHQASCNRDYSCLDGDCPAFITVFPTDAENGSKDFSSSSKLEFQDIPEPVPQISSGSQSTSYNIFMAGIGGTGVVTINQILATAAFLEGKHVRSLDQTGLSQKGGPVVSNLKISDQPIHLANRVSAGSADLYLIFDLLTGTTEKNLTRAQPDKTVAIVSRSQVPTGAMVTSPDVQYPAIDPLEAHIGQRTLADENVYLDAISLAEKLFGDHMQANLIVVGAAYQTGRLPIGHDAIDKAIVLNGVAVEQNRLAFYAGRRVVAEPGWAEALLEEPRQTQLSPLPQSEKVRKLIAQLMNGSINRTSGEKTELEQLLERRVPELIAYQSEAYAKRYVGFVQEVFEREQSMVPGETRLSEAVARYLFKLMAYKDEYEVARLHLEPELNQTLSTHFGGEARIQYQLHPPFLRYLGLKRKIGFGRWIEPVFRLLVHMRGIRGTPLDLFGYAEVRQVERALVDEYKSLINDAMAKLTPDSYEQAIELAQLPDLIRGYEEIKLRNVARFREEVKRVCERKVVATVA